MFAPSALSTLGSGTVKVFVLAGQSNMEGQAEVYSTNSTTGKLLNGTLLYQVQDPRTAKAFAPLWDDATKDWRVLDDVKMWFNEAGSEQGVNGSKFPGAAGVDASFGSLFPGYGVSGPDANKKNRIGPELGFGFGLSAAAPGEKILIMKNAWGGKTIAGDFRPPSSCGGGDPWCVGDPSCTTVGHYYKVMLQNVATIMQDGMIGKMFPDLEGLTPELSGFGWFQGLARVESF